VRFFGTALLGGLVGPIFQGGRIKRSYEAAQAQWLQAKIEYEASTANAFGEVSGALVDRTKLVETERQRARAVAAYQEAVRLANIRYNSGLSAYFEVLEAQQQLFPAEISLARTRRDQRVAVAIRDLVTRRIGSQIPSAVVTLTTAFLVMLGGAGWSANPGTPLPGSDQPGLVVRVRTNGVLDRRDDSGDEDVETPVDEDLLTRLLELVVPAHLPVRVELS